ncbi:cobaltochelatase subunit CobN [Rhizobium leguminosarum bv. trifolii]|uniref:Cobaltochelatase subunit CobN n=1 Tax=Rhizobium ruizarguesonis TaxID=2081791 RepID=A0AAE8QDV9_9HYPH|nr:cobaltochelatase subunit CobN [Rhizobium ruizarguesonis]MBY5806642.1 cobaltochelatase subunit CobN [Rhizobium leguminosarum]NKL11105.1 cobaltochelatase subunit CobN [Rhizobium leguminosarum bv. viciae]QIO43133.1 cobaltochelatase subunit CobN [Rhizobium leguminosarum bv. trifolii]MBY5846499.1 cobaltochelatase subunit CobN [Rhizobium leguminosarum]MBY5882294.1 cobaltochelatase subunit CobN [Rhizobium leguminosarum]
MHLLLAQQGTISDGEEAIDLGQTPGDILFLSAADSELAAIAAAHRDRGAGPSLRLASLMSLKHPMSVDTYIERTTRHAKLIIVRALGGASYFHYALEALHAAAARAGALIAVLPGDARPDAGLVPFSNIDLDDLNALWAYLIEGGDANARAFLDYADAMLSGAEKPAPAVPLMKAGIWWPGRGLIGIEEWRRVAASPSASLGVALPSVLPDISPTRGEIRDERSRSISSAEGTASSNVSFVRSPSDLPISPLVGEMSGRTEGGTTNSTQQASPIVAISFYRALVQSGETGPIEALIEALTTLGLRPLPVFAYSLKDPISTGILESVFSTLKPDVVINTTGFAVSAPGADRQPTVLEANEAIVLQAILSASSREAWAASSQGLSARDLGMNVALPEVDGRVLARAVSFKTAARYDALVETNIVASQADAGRVRYTAELAANWARLRKTSAGDRRIALVMANYPNRDGRLGNGVGLDTPAGTIEVLRAMRAAGYPVADIPADGDALIRHLMEGPTNSGSDGKIIRETLSLSLYNSFLESLPNKIQDEVRARWGNPQDDPYFREGVFALPFARFGEVLVGIQPARGYNIDPKESYHSPDLVPPHGYLAFYAFLRREFGAHAVIHMGKHGNLEWLPGKALALSESCYPEAILGPLPHLYPFIVNDPGEGTQAKRRSAAVIIDHLTPPLTRAESYGPLKDLEALVDEYYEASGGDPRRIRLLSRQILDLVTDIGLDRDAGIAKGESEGEALKKLDAYLCDLKEMQIRDGLHVFGLSPEGRLLTDLTVALARVPRGLGEGGDASLQRAIAADAGLGGGVRGASSFDPLDTDMAAVWTGPRPDILADVLDAPWRTNGDTVERIELLSAKFVSGERKCPEDWKATRVVLSEIEIRLKPSILACGPAEIEGLLKGLDGRFVAPGPSGAPTRGRPDVLPTGRNFYSVDSRAVPTPAAYELGKKSAELLVRRYVQDHGEWPVSFGLTAWGTSNMRTGGDDIAQALALIGVKPLWDMSSRRVTGYEIIPPAMLGRPRVDVTLRISGFFRDAFPEQIGLFDKAIRAVGALEEDAADNPIAERMRGEAARLAAAGLDEKTAARRAGYRVFGSKPGAYGAGLQALIDEKGWERRADLAEAYLVWGSYAYGAGEEGRAERGLFEERLRSVQAVIQNQDNREHDLLDSDDYYQFEGGMAAAAEQLAGARPSIYHNDHSRPEKPVIRSLEEEIGRVVRGRVVNPKWISGVMRHGYKGAAEIAATVDYLFAFAATTGAVGEHHFEAVYQAFVADPAVAGFMAEKNPAAFDEMRERLLEAIDRSLWTPRSNSARFDLATRHKNEVTQ